MPFLRTNFHGFLSRNKRPWRERIPGQQTGFYAGLFIELSAGEKIKK
jgi:hypothetical protein